jgi:Type IX secretion system membrane protein PorP/SprF
MNKHLHIVKLLFLLLLYNQGVTAQQDGASTLYMFNMLSINPAVAGSKETATFTMLSRYQWIGFKGAPMEQNLGFHTPAFSSNRLGFGYDVVVV